MKNEAAIKREIISKFSGFAARIENSAGSGMPDILAVKQGLGLLVEVKIGDPLLRPAQLAWITRAWTRGEVDVCVISWEFDWRYWQFPFKTSFTGRYHRIVSEPLLVVQDRAYVLDCIFQVYRSSKQY